MVKIGRLDCAVELLEDFVRRGAGMALNFKMIHIETTLFDHPCIAEVNRNFKARCMIQSMRDMKGFKNQS
jgi:hypothetical protein